MWQRAPARRRTPVDMPGALHEPTPVLQLEIDLSPVEWLFAVLFVLGVGIVSGRILGVSRGPRDGGRCWGHSWGCSPPHSFSATPPTRTALELLVLTFAFGLIATMVLSIALEVVLRRRRAARRPRLRTRARTVATIGGRLIEVTLIARRNGLRVPADLPLGLRRARDGRASPASSKIVAACS